MLNRVVFIFFLGLLQITSDTAAEQQANSQAIPQFELVPAPVIQLPGEVDSNSPAFWKSEWGQDVLAVMTSFGHPAMSVGTSVRSLSRPEPVSFWSEADSGRWIESVLQDPGGRLYGYYHSEPEGVCGPAPRTAPRIGAVRSLDKGLTWQDLGIILEVPSTSLDCRSPNAYFAGGVGDFSVVLNQQMTDAYFFVSVYTGTASRQGVAVARMPWSQRDTPRGNLSVWDGGAWRAAPASTTEIRRGFFEPRPIYPAKLSWHSRTESVDAYWGPSVHWNTFLDQYVMLLNRASDAGWNQEGIYISFSPVLDNPAKWTQPVKLLDSEAWYPQVVGLSRERGTDRLAGAVSRLFVGGRSEFLLVFRVR